MYSIVFGTSYTRNCLFNSELPQLRFRNHNLPKERAKQKEAAKAQEAMRPGSSASWDSETSLKIPRFFGFHRRKGRRPKSWKKSSDWQRRKPCARRKKRSKRRRRRAERRWADAFAILCEGWKDVCHTSKSVLNSSPDIPSSWPFKLHS